MPHGLQVIDAAGVVQIDSSKLIGRLVGVVTNIGTTGSITDAAFTTGTPFAIPVCDFNSISGGGLGPSFTLPGISYSPGVVSWTRPATPSSESGSVCDLYFGVF